jgi:hypothetical protein
LLTDPFVLLKTTEHTGDLDICLPDNEEGRKRETERDLLKLKRALERIVPKERRKSLDCQPRDV